MTSTGGRAGAAKGIRTLNLTEKTGPIIDARVVQPQAEVMLISSQGVMIRMAVSEISVQGRVTQGVRLMRLEEDETVVAAGTLVDDEEPED